jgi:DNA repair exonuclease SbcCD ATPase subunit
MADYDEMGAGSAVPDLREMQARLEALHQRFALLSDRVGRAQEAEQSDDLRHLAEQATAASEQVLTAALALNSPQPPELGTAMTREEVWREQAGEQREAARASLTDPKWWHAQLRRFLTWHLKVEMERAEAEASAAREDPVGALRRKLETLKGDLGFFQDKLNDASGRLASSDPRLTALEQQAGAARAGMEELRADLVTVSRVGEELQRLAGGEQG